MSGSITFVGAGPGAADLITVRGKRVLDAADVVIYAGSLVDERLLDGSRAEKYNSAGMDFDAVMDALAQHLCAGECNFVTILYGEGADEAQAQAVQARFQAIAPDAEINVVPGGQPVYSYIISVE